MGTLNHFNLALAYCQQWQNLLLANLECQDWMLKEAKEEKKIGISFSLLNYRTKYCTSYLEFEKQLLITTVDPKLTFCIESQRIPSSRYISRKGSGTEWQSGCLACFRQNFIFHIISRKGIIVYNMLENEGFTSTGAIINFNLERRGYDINEMVT